MARIVEKYELWVTCSKGGTTQGIKLHSTFETDCVLIATKELMEQARDLLDSCDCVQCDIKLDGDTVHQETVHSQPGGCGC